VSDRGGRQRGGRSDGVNLSGRQIVAGIGVLIVLIFAIANLEDAKIDFVFGDVTLPLFFVIVGSGLIGALVGAMISRHRHRNG
jgi:uncharacterized integral membrane protein